MQSFLLIPVGFLILLQAIIGSPTPITQPTQDLTPNPALLTPLHCDCMNNGICC
ncbi:hypothetical protein PTTG_25354 [Puccinia triticina 1-1 BBBD Race 1]|uniref:Hydrophobin n=1 Tax=Puccinia triticina (isolate 1-1 / race 1 (BBBD)) TaxID=630390 RepID=A0A180H2V0_PUCT1|nr:hypothetical protein PTTG_25354 [Puccinia triticina 1-1 BBBD Race 1]